MVISYAPQADSLRASVQKNNFTIQAAEFDRRISLQSLREARSYYYPQLDGQAGYNFVKNENEAGFLLSNRNTGLNYGLTLRWNLFNGLNTRRVVGNARLEAQSAGYYLEDTKLRISTDLEKALRDFESNKLILALEEENILLARENLDIAFERFRSGLYTSLQLKDAQLSFQDAEVRLVQVQYATKLSETELMRLNGELVK
jgi:outer membrane protein TolC